MHRSVDEAHRARRRVVGQDRAVDVVSDAVLRSRAGLAARNRGSSFLFLVRRAASFFLAQQPGTGNDVTFRPFHWCASLVVNSTDLHMACYSRTPGMHVHRGIMSALLICPHVQQCHYRPWFCLQPAHNSSFLGSMARLRLLPFHYRAPRAWARRSCPRRWRRCCSTTTA